MTKLQKLIEITKGPHISAFDAEGEALKTEFHQLSKYVLKQIAKLLRVKAEIKSNMAGPAVSGEVNFRVPGLYIQFGDALWDRHLGILYRHETTTGVDTTRYFSGPNRWMRPERLFDMQSAVTLFQTCMNHG